MTVGEIMYSVISMRGATNETVTDYYMDIVYDGIKCVAEADQFVLGELPPKSNTVVVATVIEALRLSIRGYPKIGIWLQGVLPEESYMKHHSKLRKWVLERIEKRAIKKATLLFAVSDAMVEHYEKKYRLRMRDKTFVMPCLSLIHI